MAPRKGFRHRASKSGEIPSNRRKKQSKSLKKKIRDAERLLAKPDLPATVRVAQERMLDMMKGSLQEKAVQDREQKLVKKYKKVKFFEKRKIMRKFKTCSKELEACSDEERKDLEVKLEEIKKMYNYVVYFPSDMKYISLFPPIPHDNLEVQQKQEAIFKLITEKVSNGEIEDASKNMLLASKEKKPRALYSKKKVTLSEDRAVGKIADESEDDEMSGKPERTGLTDDFFIDTKPDVQEKEGSYRKGTDRSRMTHTGSQFTLLGSPSRNSPPLKDKKRDKYDERKAKKTKKAREER